MKYAFLSDQQITEIYDVSSKEALKDQFTPTALANLVIVPDSAKEGQLYDGTNLTDRVSDQRTDADKASEEKWYACKTHAERWQFALDDELTEKFKDDAAGLEEAKKQFDLSFANYTNPPTSKPPST